MPQPGTSLYAPIKRYMVEWSRALRAELTGTGVHVTALCPGLTHTDIFGEGRARLEAKVPGVLWQTPDEVARAGLHAVEKNRARHVPGWANRAQLALARALPEPVVQRLVSGAKD